MEPGNSQTPCECKDVCIYWKSEVTEKGKDRRQIFYMVGHSPNAQKSQGLGQAVAKCQDSIQAAHVATHFSHLPRFPGCVPRELDGKLEQPQFDSKL